MPARVFYFNPTCEIEVSNGLPNYMPPRHLRVMRDSMSSLPWVYADADDTVLVNVMPDDAFLKRMKVAGFTLPHFRLLSDIDRLSADLVPTPWGWSPVSARVLQGFGTSWNPELYPFYSRQFSLQILQGLLQLDLPHLIASDEVATELTTLEAVDENLQAWGNGVIKAPYSSSGRGVQILNRPDVDACVMNKTKSIIKQQGLVMMEPLLDKICDFAFEFEIKDGKIGFVAYSHFGVSPTGQYDSHFLPFDISHWPDEARVLWDTGIIETVKDELVNVLSSTTLSSCYEGYLGVDALIFRRKNGEVCLQPCLEINLRYNMGIVGWSLESHIATGSRAIFKIEHRRDLNFDIYDKVQQEECPLIVDDGKIVSGYLPLTPPSEDAQNMACIFVSKS